jgi:hypothetical protein
MWWKLNEFNKQKQVFSKITVTSELLLVSFTVAYRIAKCKRTHSNGESSVLLAATDIVEMMLGEM